MLFFHSFSIIIKCFFLNWGIDRPNITYSHQLINSSTDYASLDKLYNAVNNSKGTMLFTNNRQKTQEIARRLQTLKATISKPTVAYFHALHSSLAKTIVLKLFHSGKINTLVTTEAAGMVCKRIYIFIS